MVEEQGHLAGGQGNGIDEYLWDSLEPCWERRG